MSKLRFAETKVGDTDKTEKEPWIVLVADDEGDIHMVTKMVLKNFRFEDRPVDILSSYSGDETLELMKKHPNTAILLLDVVMESYTAGLDVVSELRGNNRNHEVRILLRSGQSGYANISELIKQYDINAFLRKESLSQQDLKDAVLLALRSYRDIQMVKDQQSGDQ